MKRPMFFLAMTLVLSSFAAAEEFNTPVSVTSSTSATDFWPVINLIQGPGVGFDAKEPHDKLLWGPEGLWVTDDPGGFPSDYFDLAPPPVLVFDMGGDVSMDEISIWGYDSMNANGVSEFSLRFATDADGLGGFGTSIIFNPTYSLLPTNDDTVRQSFEFGKTFQARYVELTCLDNFFVPPGDGSGGETPGGDRVGLGEVSFRQVAEQGPFVPPASYTVFRGMEISGSLADFADSDDVLARYNPGFVLNSSEAPVWLVFDAVAPTAFEFLVESQAGTPGLTYTVEAWNWNSSEYDVIDTQAEAFNADQVQTFPIVNFDHVDQAGNVRSRIGWRKTGLTINFPWEIRIDQVGWNQ